MTSDAARVLRVLRETGPRPLSVIGGLIVGAKVTCPESVLQRVVGELFIAGAVEWKSAKRWRVLAARKAAR